MSLEVTRPWMPWRTERGSAREGIILINPAVRLTRRREETFARRKEDREIVEEKGDGTLSAVNNGLRR
jgi:hypothetical protein